MLEHFREQFGAQFGSMVSPDALRPLREKGWKRFESLGLPSKKNEAYRYIPLRELYQHRFTLAKNVVLSKEAILSAIDPSALHSHIVFVNGFFSPDLSDVTGLPSQVQLMPFSVAMRSHASFLNNRLSKAIAEEKDPFAALNAAVHGEGLFVYVPPKLVLKQPIQCVYVDTDGDQQMLSSPRIHLFLGKESEVDWITTSHGGSGSTHLNATLDAALEEGSQLRLSNQIVPEEKRWHFEAVRATLKKNSRLHSVSLSSGGGYARQDYRVLLAGEGAEAQLVGLTVLKGKSQGHAHLLVEHAAPYTQSMQRFKTLLDRPPNRALKERSLCAKRRKRPKPISSTIIYSSMIGRLLTVSPISKFLQMMSKPLTGLQFLS